MRVRRELTDAPQYKTVNELLTNAAQFDGCYADDPFGDELDDDRAFGTLLLSAKTPTLSAFDSGNSSYALTKNSNDVDPELREITIAEGGTSKAVKETATALATTGTFFNYGKLLACIVQDRAQTLNVDQIAFYAGDLIEFSKEKRTKEGLETRRCDPPVALCKQLYSLLDRPLPDLVAATDRPQFRKDGTLIECAGYDHDTGIYITRSAAEFSSYQPDASEVQLQEAIETCTKPASQYKLNEFGKTSFLCAVLTAVFRPTFDIAPAIVVRSPDIGSGKSIMCQALANIAESEPTSTQTKPDGEAEMKKLLLALLLSGTKVILFDNADGALRSKKLAAFSTSPTWSDRILGKSAMGQDLPIRSTLIMNGRGAYSADGMSRRVIPLDILPKERSEMFKVYDFDPAALAKETRDQIIGAAMTLITAVPDSFKCAGTVPTYSRWDHLIRRTVAWLSQLDADLVDPIEVFKDEIYSDSEIGDRKGLLDFLRALIDEGMPGEFRAVDILSKAKEHDLMLELEEHLNSVTTSSATLSGRGIGTILSLLKDQDICGLRLTARPSRGKMLWRIEGEEQEEEPFAA